MSVLSKQLKKLMSDAGMSQKMLSDATGLSKSTISQYLSDKRIPSNEIKQKIAAALNCSVERLNIEDTIETQVNDHCVSVKECARRIGKSQMFVRVALQKGSAPFGFAVQNKKRWTYHISPKKLSEYIGTTN